MTARRRETVSPGAVSPGGEWFTDEWTRHILWSTRLKGVLRDVRSPFQHVLVADTEALGRMLVLDGNIQVTERDEAAYHELIVHPGLCRAGAPTGDRRVLIIGGGDGGAAREALRHPDVVQVDFIDIDPEVTRAARELLPSIWRRPDGSGPLHEDPRLTVRNEDGIAFVEADGPEYDLVVVDATDPVGPGAVLFSERFYAAVRRRTRQGGAVAVQAGSWWFLPHVLQAAHGGLSQAFPRAEAYQCWSAVYPGGVWNLVIATFGDDPAEPDEARIARLPDLQWYDAAVHRAAFALPPNARRVLEQG